jgi:hypothetical protein
MEAIQLFKIYVHKDGINTDIISVLESMLNVVVVVILCKNQFTRDLTMSGRTKTNKIDMIQKQMPYVIIIV